MREDGRPRGLTLLPIASFPRARAEALAALLSRWVDLPCTVGATAPLEGVPRLVGRDQLDADRLLARLEARVPKDGSLLLGLTQEDLGNPIFTFFFGRARLSGRAAVVSLARLDPAFYGLPADDRVTTRRAVAELLHEMGHAAGLAHCPSSACVMHFVRTVEDLDLRGAGYCPVCRAALPFPTRG